MKKTLLPVLLTCFLSGATSTAAAKDPFKPCYNKAISTLQIQECISKEHQFYEKRLKNKLHQLTQYLSPTSDKALKKAQLAWQRFKKADCLFKGSKYAGGTLAPVIVGECYIKRTKQRIILLQKEILFFKDN